MSARVSVVLNTLNAEEWLEFSLRSVKPWADEIVVADMHSDDRTVEIARSFGARVFTHEREGYVEPARAFAVEQAAGPWVLLLDADEMVPPLLSRALLTIAAEDRVHAVRLPRLNWFFGSPMRYAGWGPTIDRHLRFFRRGAVEFPLVIHGQIRPATGSFVVDLPARPDTALVHFNYLDTSQFIERLNRYTTVEAESRLQRGVPVRAAGATWGALREFASRYFRSAGFRDGWRGLFLSVAMLFYRLTVYAKQRELLGLGPRERVAEHYRKEAERLLAGYR